jgi:adenylosuccinate synthase
MLEQIIRTLLDDAGKLVDAAPVTSQYPKQEDMIFEGAQGLMLDEDRIDQFPHLTRSKTDLSNVLFLARKLELDALEVTYVTRSYLTRHGQGSLPGECDLWFPDQTNVPNQFQGRLRFAPLHTGQLNESVNADLARARRSFRRIEPNLAVTCLDQMDMPGTKHLCLPVKYRSFGQTREDISAVNVHALAQR